MKKCIAVFFISLNLSLAFGKGRPLPPVQAPRELIDPSSEFSEGTITKLSATDIAQFLPWAQNAQSILMKALKDIQTMTVADQVRHLDFTIRSVIRNSGDKNYQMFMRFALSRGVLLIQELQKEADINIAGTEESMLDMQVRSIRVALSFYESDLSYQKRASQGQDVVNLDYAVFGNTFAMAMKKSIDSVLDASAQYRLLYKVYEMLNWDLSRDQNAPDYSEQIVDIFNTLDSMSEFPTQDDMVSIRGIRKLNLLDKLNFTYKDEVAAELISHGIDMILKEIPQLSPQEGIKQIFYRLPLINSSCQVGQRVVGVGSKVLVIDNHVQRAGDYSRAIKVRVVSNTETSVNAAAVGCEGWAVENFIR